MTTTKKLESLKEIFPGLECRELFPLSNIRENEGLVSCQFYNLYETMFISPCTNESPFKRGEVMNFTMFFDDELSAREEKLETYRLIENCYIKFYRSIYNFGVYVFEFDDSFSKICDIDDYELLVKDQIREAKFYFFLVPELGVMISGNFDLNHVVHASRPYYKKEEFEKIVKESGLYILR